MIRMTDFLNDIISLKKMKKRELRKIYLDRQLNLDPEEKREKDRQIRKRFFTDFDLEVLNVLHLFLSIEEKGEVDTKRIAGRLRRNYSFLKIAVPRVNPEADILEHLEFNAKTEFVRSRWGIDEPTGDAFVDEQEIDLVLVPLLCFTKWGYRVGYGKGFYDKFLNRCRPDCLRVGLSFFPPVEEIEDLHEFDVPVNFCITPDEIYRF
jgi:5-formyltetrahydrofolate cyclo-ligase